MEETNGFNLSTDLPGQIISEIVKVLGILTAVTAFVLLWQDTRFWLVSVIAGVLVFLAGLLYAFRLYRRRRKRKQALAAARERFLSESQIPPRQVVIHEQLDPTSESDSTVFIDPEIDKKLEAVQAMYATGLMTNSEFERLNDELNAQKRLALAQVQTISQKLAALKRASDTGVITEAVYKQRVAALSAEQVDVLEETEAWNVLPPVVITIGFFLVLPGIINLIMQQGDNDNAVSFTGYFFTPAIILWIISEILFLFPFLEVKSKRVSELVGIIGPGVQGIGAIVLWVYLGLTILTTDLVLIFYAGAGLALLGLILTLIAIVLNYRHGKHIRNSALLALQAANDQAVHLPDSLPSPDVQDDTPVVAVNDDHDASTPTAVSLLPQPQTAQFELFIGQNDKHYFRLRDDSGQILLTSQGYRTGQGCENGIDSVKKNVLLTDRFEQKMAADGRFYFVLLAGNHQVIAVSQMFDSEEERQTAIAAVTETAVAAPSLTFNEL